jgi:hypothetical protein
LTDRFPNGNNFQGGQQTPLMGNNGNMGHNNYGKFNKAMGNNNNKNKKNNGNNNNNKKVM